MLFTVFLHLVLLLLCFHSEDAVILPQVSDWIRDPQPVQNTCREVSGPAVSANTENSCSFPLFKTFYNYVNYAIQYIPR